MKHKFTLEFANIIANLTLGRVMSCYRDICDSEENFEKLICFCTEFEESVHSSEPCQYFQEMCRIKKDLRTYGLSKGYLDNSDRRKIDTSVSVIKEKAIRALSELSDILSRCTVKSLLLPKIKSSQDSDTDFMTSPDTLRHLPYPYRGESNLILRLHESPKSITILNAFPNFETALRQADLWPAVLFWKDLENFVFVPVSNKIDLFRLFEVIHCERDPIYELKRLAEKRKRASHYFFHLSDLHFGAKNIDIFDRRLRSLIKTKMSSLEIDDTVDFLITGDIFDSPNRVAVNEYRDFSDYLEERYGKKPICVWGNHDLNNRGLSFLLGDRSMASILGKCPRIKILKKLKVILLLFNSNAGGTFAQGKIGKEQMLEMGNLLDRINNLTDYLLVAVLHHHLFPIPNPEHYDKEWYKKMIPNSVYEKTLELTDADLFIEWLAERNVKVVLHGHKHIPFTLKQNRILVVSCGSSTGKIIHKEKGKTYISYNLIKISKHAVTCTQFVEDTPGCGVKNIRVVTQNR